MEEVELYSVGDILKINDFKEHRVMAICGELVFLTKGDSMFPLSGEWLAKSIVDSWEIRNITKSSKI